jgi:hypothetical protein
MDPSVRPSARVWLTGHSSGAAAAQLLALRLAGALGPARVGGVLLFNSDRAGSARFARHYDSVLGNRTLRYGYGLGESATERCLTERGLGGQAWVGWDGRAQGLASRRRGKRARQAPRRPRRCNGPPRGRRGRSAARGGGGRSRGAGRRGGAVAGAAAFRAGLYSDVDGGLGWVWVALALGWVALALGWIGCWKGKRTAPTKDQTKPTNPQIAEWDSFSHHFPHLLFDSLLHILGGALDAPAAAALRLPECVVSDRCSAALRRRGGAEERCMSCASDATCSGGRALAHVACLFWCLCAHALAGVRGPCVHVGCSWELVGASWVEKGLPHHHRNRVRKRPY